MAFDRNKDRKKINILTDLLLYKYVYIYNTHLKFCMAKNLKRCVMVKALDYGIVVSSNSSRAITSTFAQIPLGKVWTPVILPAIEEQEKKKKENDDQPIFFSWFNYVSLKSL